MTDNTIDVENGNADERLRLLIERIETLAEEKKGISEDMKDVYGEAKAVGYDVKVLKDVVKRRAIERAAVEEHDAVLATYESALG